MNIIVILTVSVVNADSLLLFLNKGNFYQISTRGEGVEGRGTTGPFSLCEPITLTEFCKAMDN